MALLALTCLVSLDRLFYGTWTFPPWNFLLFNFLTVSERGPGTGFAKARSLAAGRLLLQPQANVFGVHPWHWLLTTVAGGAGCAQLSHCLLGHQTGLAAVPPGVSDCVRHASAGAPPRRLALR